MKMTKGRYIAVVIWLAALGMFIYWLYENWRVLSWFGGTIGITVLGFLFWLIPSPLKWKPHLIAFWEALKMSSESRLLHAKLNTIWLAQRESPQKYIYFISKVDSSLSDGQSPNTVKVRLQLVSCLLEDTPIDKAEFCIGKFYDNHGEYFSPNWQEFEGIKNILRLQAQSVTATKDKILIIDDNLREILQQDRQNNTNTLGLKLRLTIRGKTEEVKQLNTEVK